MVYYNGKDNICYEEEIADHVFKREVGYKLQLTLCLLIMTIVVFNRFY